MNKNNENKLIPKLRFPEFKNGGWKEVAIDSVGEVVTGGTPSKEKSEYWDGDFLWITAQDFKDKYITDSVLKLTQKGKEKSRIIPKDSVLVTCIASIGLNGINKVECATNQQINSVICNSEHNFEFVYYAITKNGTRLKSIAGQTAVPIINKSSFEKFVIHKPSTYQEQQKIASCLSSLDDLITAEGKKLEVLKEHKKGLLQNLFPQEGETVPKLRFPEFTNEIWKRKTIDETCEVLNNLRKPLTSNLREKGEYPYYGASGIIDFVKDFIFNERLLLIGEDGAKWGAYEKTAFIAEGKYWVNNHAHVLKPTGVVDTLLENYLVKLDLSPFITGAAPPKLTLGKLKSIPVPIPNSRKEQQKIASCLSSVDELIIAQAQKIEVLQLHKKGLLQGLFPNLNEGNDG